MEHAAGRLGDARQLVKGQGAASRTRVVLACSPSDTGEPASSFLLLGALELSRLPPLHPLQSPPDSWPGWIVARLALETRYLLFWFEKKKNPGMRCVGKWLFRCLYCSTPYFVRCERWGIRWQACVGHQVWSNMIITDWHESRTGHHCLA
jgi:hypothetical protein